MRANLVGLLALFAIFAATFAHAQPASPGAVVTATKMPEIPKGKETDVKFYRADGSIATGGDAFDQMSGAGLILWLAGNQFFAMDDVVKAFQNRHAGTSVGLITLPPGLLLEAIKAGGWIYNDREYLGRPDIYASVNLGHFKQLKASGMMDRYMVYMHNELQIMVAKGNPRKIAKIEDLVRGGRAHLDAQSHQ